MVIGFRGERFLEAMDGEIWVGDGDRGGRTMEECLEAFDFLALVFVAGTAWDFLTRELVFGLGFWAEAGDELRGGANVSLSIVLRALIGLEVGIAGRGGFG